MIILFADTGLFETMGIWVACAISFLLALFIVVKVFKRDKDNYGTGSVILTIILTGIILIIMEIINEYMLWEPPL
jgi:uncharacterized membrane protein